MTKRKKLVLESLLLTISFLITQEVEADLRYWAIGGLGIFTYFLTALILKPDLKKVGWVTVLLPPVFFVVWASLFYFLLPAHIVTKLIILGFFGISCYAALLSENILSIASSFQAIQLVRAAQTISFLITLITAFLGFSTLFSFKGISFANGFFSFLLVFPLVLNSLWSITLEEKIDITIIIYSLVISFLTAQTTYFISFWPLSVTSYALFMVGFLYVVLGIVQSYLNKKLFKNTLQEFLNVGLAIFIISFLLTSW